MRCRCKISRNETTRQCRHRRKCQHRYMTPFISTLPSSPLTLLTVLLSTSSSCSDTPSHLLYLLFLIRRFLLMLLLCIIYLCFCICSSSIHVSCGKRCSLWSYYDLHVSILLYHGCVAYFPRVYFITDVTGKASETRYIS